MKKRSLFLLFGFAFLFTGLIGPFAIAEDPCSLPEPYLCGMKRGVITVKTGWGYEFYWCCKNSIPANGCDPTGGDISEWCRTIIPN